MFNIQKPYLVFLGDAPDQLAAKTARGILDWRPDDVVGQMRLEDCGADLGIDDLTLDEAWDRGARTFVIGTANRGGVIPDHWNTILKMAIARGFDIANGLHKRIADLPDVAAMAKEHGRMIHDVRHVDQPMPIGTGEKRTGKRLLPLGTDCSCGKMYTALSLHRDMEKRGIKSTFRATGQTGILIDGSGISVDAVISDFLAGATEILSPAGSPDHWDIIEGQGSLGHPSYAGVTTGLIHGSQPDALVLCHEPTRTHMRGLPHQPLPTIDSILELGTALARVVNPDARFVGICVNSSHLREEEVAGYLQSLEDKYGLPAVDPFKHGTDRIIDQLLET